MDSYDFDNSQEWKEYLCNIYIPPNMNEEIILQKYKQRFYKKFIDPSFVINDKSSDNNDNNTSFNLQRNQNYSNPDNYSSSIPTTNNYSPNLNYSKKRNNNTKNNYSNSSSKKQANYIRDNMLFTWLSTSIFSIFIGFLCLFPILYWIFGYSYFHPNYLYKLFLLLSGISFISSYCNKISNINFKTITFKRIIYYSNYCISDPIFMNGFIGVYLIFFSPFWSFLIVSMAFKIMGIANFICLSNNIFPETLKQECKQIITLNPLISYFCAFLELWSWFLLFSYVIENFISGFILLMYYSLYLKSRYNKNKEFKELSNNCAQSLETLLYHPFIPISIRKFYITCKNRIIHNRN